MRESDAAGPESQPVKAWPRVASRGLLNRFDLPVRIDAETEYPEISIKSRGKDTIRCGPPHGP